MIIGSCPYDDCTGDLWIPLADKTPAFQKHACKTCARTIWTYHSRLDPWSATEADFLAEYSVNEATHEITKKPETPK